MYKKYTKQLLFYNTFLESSPSRPTLTKKAVETP